MRPRAATYVRIQKTAMLLALCLFLLAASAKAETGPESIELFRSDIEVRKDGTFTVEEHITYVFPDERHGIFRCIPTKHPDKPSSILKERYFDIELREVKMDNAPVPYTVDEKRRELCLTIGDPNATLSGTHTYDITYDVAGGISFLEFGGAELYWNVTGNDWEVPMRYAEAHVTTPDGIFFRERACYQGPQGEATSCETATEENGDILFRGKYFKPGEGLTIAQALNRNAIPYDVREQYHPFMLWGMIFLSLVLLVAYLLYRYETKNKTDAPIIPQYEPYPEVKPMYAGVLLDERLNPNDITACIVDLARRGFLKIRKTNRKVFFFFESDDYEVILLKSFDDSVGRFERMVAHLLFREEGGTETDDLAALVNTGTSLTDLAGDKDVLLKNRTLIERLKKELMYDLEDAGFFQVTIPRTIHTTVQVVLVVLLFILIVPLMEHFSWLTLGILLADILFLVILQVTYRRRTRKGYEALDHLKGFRDFLSVTEKERYIFHNAPERNADQFMEFLPYAIAFGVEKQWAKTFDSITIPNPDWYEGGNVGSFNPVGLSQSLSAFSTAVAHASAPQGASGGGGFSGGGGGGGGGGSW